MKIQRQKARVRHDGRVIIHFDYDCFYAAVFEAENPALRSLPLAVQQKQIVVTCNYEARRRGLHKLQLVTVARQICPDVIIVLGEDLTRFRNASKSLYNALQHSVWSQRAERLGFDEVFLDVTSMIDYNIEMLNSNDLTRSFFHLSKTDPLVGFSYDASVVCGHTYPSAMAERCAEAANVHDIPLQLRLTLGSHLAWHLRHKLEQERGYTSTVGISTSKLLSKLVGNCHKPNGQTTLMPPYGAHVGEEGNVTNFIDAHDVGSIPGIGFKIAQQLRHHVLGRPARFDAGLVYGGTKEHLTVGDVRMFPGIGPEVLETILSGPGAVHGIGMKIWNLLRGVDDVEVDRARSVPKQISIEDSYIRLDTIDQVRKELLTLARSLMKRMHVDLLVRCDETEGGNINADTLGADKKPRTSATEVRDQRHNEEKQVPMVERGAQRRRWRAHPRMLRLTTRPRLLRTADGSKSRTFQRTSRSGPMPSFVFSLEQSDEALAQRLVHEALLPLFRKLHPERSGWNLSLVNIAATSIVNVAGTEDDAGVARNIGSMLRNQESSLAPWKLDADSGECEQDGDAASPKRTREKSRISAVSVLEACIPSSNSPSEDHWEVDEGQGMADNVLAEIQCSLCEAFLPQFAVTAHARYHTLGE